MRRAALCLQLIISFLLIAATAQASEPIPVSKACWVDPARQATFEDAVNAPFLPCEGAVTQGYTHAAVWLKLRIPGHTSTEPLALIVQPAFLSRIELYDPISTAGGEKSHPVLSGRDAEIEPDNHIGLDNGFIIAASTAPRVIFLRITTTTSLSADVSVLPLGSAQHHSAITTGILAVYFAFLLGFCLWGAVNLLVRRESIYALFVARLIYSMAHLFVFIGLLRYFLSHELSASTRDFIYCFVSITAITVVGIFDVRILSDFGASPWLRKVFHAALALPAISMLLLLFGHAQAALRVNALIVTTVVVLLLLLALSTRDTQQKPYERMAVLIVRAGFLLMTIVIIIPAFMHQNLIRASLPVMNLLFLHAVISATILSAVLSIRARQRDWQAQQAQFQYQLKERELQAENERRIEKERFLSMLTHELRNPLALIRLVTTTDSPSGRTVEKAALEMARVIERVEQSEKLDDKAIQVEMTHIDLKAALQELAVHSTAARRIDLEVQAGCTAVSDETLMRSIIRNLLENADKYSPASSRIRLSAAAMPADGKDGAEGVKITVRNEAGDAGVPDPEKLFTKYYRSKRAHRQPGSGLGLFLVANWARALGGKISYDQNQNGDGSQTVSFSLWVPQ